MLKAGVSGEDAPCCVFPSFVRFPRSELFSMMQRGAAVCRERRGLLEAEEQRARIGFRLAGALQLPRAKPPLVRVVCFAHACAAKAPKQF